VHLFFLSLKQVNWCFKRSDISHAFGFNTSSALKLRFQYPANSWPKFLNIRHLSQLARQEIVIIISFSNISRAGKYNALCVEFAQYSKACVTSCEVFVFSKMFRPALGPTHPRSQWVVVA